MAPSTKKVYDQVLQSFKTFRNNLDLKDGWPIPLRDIIDFIAFMFKNNLSHSTSNCYISVLSFHSKLINVHDSTYSFVVRKMIDGVKRVSLNGKDARLPITRKLLNTILSLLNAITKSQYEACLFRAAFSLCFHGMFSVSELTSLDEYSFNHAISNQDFKMLGDGLEVFLRTSEMDQFGSRVTIFISSQPDKRICPASALVDYLSRHSH